MADYRPSPPNNDDLQEPRPAIRHARGRPPKGFISWEKALAAVVVVGFLMYVLGTVLGA